MDDKNDFVDIPKFVIVEKNILNLDEIMKIRINNIFAKADKKEKEKIIKIMDKFNDFVFDTEIGYLASIIVDSTVLVATKDSILLGVKYASTVEQLNLSFDILPDIFEKVLNKKYLVAYITDDEWKKYAKEYVDNLKNNIKYEFIDEPEIVFEENKKDDIIFSSAIDLFGKDIVEISKE